MTATTLTREGSINALTDTEDYDTNLDPRTMGVRRRNAAKEASGLAKVAHDALTEMAQAHAEDLTVLRDRHPETTDKGYPGTAFCAAVVEYVDGLAGAYALTNKDGWLIVAEPFALFGVSNALIASVVGLKSQTVDAADIQKIWMCPDYTIGTDGRAIKRKGKTGPKPEDKDDESETDTDETPITCAFCDVEAPDTVTERLWGCQECLAARVALANEPAPPKRQPDPRVPEDFVDKCDRAPFAPSAALFREIAADAASLAEQFEGSES